MSYETFDSTVQSGVGWLGDIPSHWEVVPAKSLFSLRTEKALPNDVHLTPSQKYGVLPQVEYMEITGNRVVLNLMDSGQMKHVEPNDFVSHLRSFQGGLELSRIRGKVSGAYTVLTPRNDQNPEFWKYALKSDTYIQALQTTTDQLRDGQSIRLKEIAQIPLPLVPRAEQDAIVEYLDTELALLDHSIEKLSELKNKVSEFRRASIVQAVQLGIESNSDTEPGPEPYLPRVRKDWGFGALKRFVDFGSGSGFPEIDQGIETEEIPFLKVNSLGQAAPNGLISVRTDTISRSTAKRLGASVFPAGSLVMAKIGAALLLGRVGVLSEASCVDNNMMVVIPKSDQHPRYYYYMLQTLEFASFVNPGAVPSTSGTAVGRQVVSKVPVAEQKRISDHLDSICETSDALSGSIEKSLGLLNARRTALISAAVTGKHELEGAN